MSTFTIYVPSYVNLKAIQTCPLDSRATFVTVDPETLSIEAKRQEHSKFIVFEKDHFLVYEKESPEPFKCSYYSRNHIMYCVGYLGLTTFIRNRIIQLEEENGCFVFKRQNVLSFIYRPDAECLDEKHRDCGGGIAEFYDTVEEEDFERFAEIARTKESCVKELFVVNRGQTYHIVDTNDPSIRYTCGPAIKTHSVWRLINKKVTFKGLADEQNEYLKRKEKAKCVAGFELRDNQGVPLPEGTKFKLEIYNEEYHGIKDAGAKSNAKVTIQYLAAVDLGDGAFMIHGTVDKSSKFGFKVIDGITYLTYSNSFFGIFPCDDTDDLLAIPVIPPKQIRVQVQYAEDGNIFLSGWDGCSIMYCSWIKSSHGRIIISTDEADMRWTTPMKLVIKV
ncbi:hypothetical protein LPJ56_001850 [Coemansia sp. RSA 2599]|nr:hypothetical protein LPJ75_002885 [Coemansia sp. RSA 2598]KAJ1827088.1 hypothetical protein LPJ56_001850 [Coemansia sp. RSA 2599]